MASNSTIVRRLRQFFEELNEWIDKGAKGSDHKIFENDVGICANCEMYFDDKYPLDDEGKAELSRILRLRLEKWYVTYHGEKLKTDFPFNNQSFHEYVKEMKDHLTYRNKERLHFIRYQIGRSP